MKKLNILQELALLGFKLGDDNYGETIMGVSDIIKYHKVGDYHSITVFLEEENNHQSTSGIGFYLKENKTKLMVYSSKEVITVDVNNEIKTLIGI